MDFEPIWSRLDADSQAWLMAHNAEPLDDALLELIPAEWIGDDSALVDDAVDWIEAVANGE